MLSSGDISFKTNTWPISRVKVDNKNYNKHFIKHDKDNNSQF